MNKPPQPCRRLIHAMAECCWTTAQCLLGHGAVLILPWQYIFKLKHRSESDILELMNKEVEIL